MYLITVQFPHLYCICFFFSGEVIIPVSFQFVIDEDFSTDLLNRSSSRFVALEGNIRRAVRKLSFMVLAFFSVELYIL